MAKTDLSSYLSELPLQLLDETEQEAGLWCASLPWPRAAAQPVSLGNRPTYNKPLGQWPDNQNSPRRILLFADGENQAPATVSTGVLPHDETDSPDCPTASMNLLERSTHVEYVWEKHSLCLQQNGRSIELAMGLKVGEEVHWWEACRLVVLEESPQCLTIEMGGAIPYRHMTIEEFQQYAGYSNPYLHRHNWVNGHIFARLHRNGVCEIFAHHINSKFFDDGGELEGAVPVLGLKTAMPPENLSDLCGAWDGSVDSLQLGEIALDVREVSRFATPEQPGQMSYINDFLVWQPYQGMELFGGMCPQQLTGDPYIYRAEKQIIPRGMARTLRFSLSLSDRSPRIARYQAPDWWYGACEEFSPASLLPVSNAYDETFNRARQWVQESVHQGGFEDGSLPRGNTKRKAETDAKRHEPGWEGEISYGQFLAAWRSGDNADYQAALRSAYHFTDVAVDHATKAVRMHGYAPPAVSVPMNRVQGTIAAYLETGDPYLIETARAVVDQSYWTNKNSWPRMTIGRDACFMRSAVLLYRYFGEEHYRRIAHEIAYNVIETQRENGSFGDQGGGSGIHQWGGYITKPWMGMLALNGVLDYLELFPDEQPLAVAVKKFADWLLEERHEREGVLTWAYQHDFNGGRTYRHFHSGETQILPGPAGWHQENLARLMAFCSMRFDDPSYLAAWAESRRQTLSLQSDHPVSAALQFTPWIQDHLWNATLQEEGVALRPLSFGDYTPSDATLSTPNGARAVHWPDFQNGDPASGVTVARTT